MKRTTSCAATLVAVAAVSNPSRRAAAATEGSDISAKGLDGRALTLKAADVDADIKPEV